MAGSALTDTPTLLAGIVAVGVFFIGRAVYVRLNRPSRTNARSNNTPYGVDAQSATGVKCIFCKAPISRNDVVYEGTPTPDRRFKAARGAQICARCVRAAEDLVRAEGNTPTSHEEDIAGGMVSCSFCWKRFSFLQKVIVTTTININLPEDRNYCMCLDCVRIAREKIRPSPHQDLKSECLALVIASSSTMQFRIDIVPPLSLPDRCVCCYERATTSIKITFLDRSINMPSCGGCREHTTLYSGPSGAARPKDREAAINAMGSQCCAPDRSSADLWFDHHNPDRMTLKCRGTYADEIIRINPKRAKWTMDVLDYQILEDAATILFPETEYEKQRVSVFVRCGYLRPAYDPSEAPAPSTPTAYRLTPEGEAAIRAHTGDQKRVF